MIPVYVRGAGVPQRKEKIGLKNTGTVLKFGYPSCKSLRKNDPKISSTISHVNKVPMKIRNQAPNTQRPLKVQKRCKDKTEVLLLLVP